MKAHTLGDALIEVLHVVEGLVGEAAMLAHGALDVLTRELLVLGTAGELQ